MNDIETTTWWERYRARSANGEHRIELYVRSLAPSYGTHDDHAALLDGLEAAAEDGPIDSYDVTVLGKEVCLCDRCRRTDAGREARSACLRLRRGGSAEIAPHGFEERRVRSEITGAEYSVVVPPAVCLGVYDGEDLLGVFPSTVEGRDVDVLAFLDALRRNRTGPDPPKIDA